MDEKNFPKDVHVPQRMDPFDFGELWFLRQNFMMVDRFVARSGSNACYCFHNLLLCLMCDAQSHCRHRTDLLTVFLTCCSTPLRISCVALWRHQLWSQRLTSLRPIVSVGPRLGKSLVHHSELFVPVCLMLTCRFPGNEKMLLQEKQDMEN